MPKTTWQRRARLGHLFGKYYESKHADKARDQKNKEVGNRDKQHGPEESSYQSDSCHQWIPLEGGGDEDCLHSNAGKLVADLYQMVQTRPPKSSMRCRTVDVKFLNFVDSLGVLDSDGSGSPQIDTHLADGVPRGSSRLDADASELQAFMIVDNTELGGSIQHRELDVEFLDFMKCLELKEAYEKACLLREAQMADSAAGSGRAHGTLRNGLQQKLQPAAQPLPAIEHQEVPSDAAFDSLWVPLKCGGKGDASCSDTEDLAASVLEIVQGRDSKREIQRRVLDTKFLNFAESCVGGVSNECVGLPDKAQQSTKLTAMSLNSSAQLPATQIITNPDKNSSERISTSGSGGLSTTSAGASSSGVTISAATGLEQRSVCHAAEK